MKMDHKKIEDKLLGYIIEVKEKLKLESAVTTEVCPGEIGISSQILITIIGRIGFHLDVVIPDNCYLFYDKDKKRQLSIKEATNKLIKVVSDGI